MGLLASSSSDGGNPPEGQDQQDQHQHDQRQRNPGVSRSLEHLVPFFESELPTIRRRKNNGGGGGDVADLSLRGFKEMLATGFPGGGGGGRGNNKRNHRIAAGRNFARFIGNDYKSRFLPTIKKWSTEGNTTALEDYLRNERVPALWSVYDRYFGRGSGSRATTTTTTPQQGQQQQRDQQQQQAHFVKVGHTSVFYHPAHWYDVLSSATMPSSFFDSDSDSDNGEHEDEDASQPGRRSGGIEVDFVRIHRNRIDTAHSFAASAGGRHGPVKYARKAQGLVTSPAMGGSLLGFSSIGGPLPETTWNGWTVFQQYLWYADEIEAKWKDFRARRPGARCHTLSYSHGGDRQQPQRVLSAKSIDDLALNFLGLGTRLSPYMKTTSKQSHLGSQKTAARERTRAENTRQAIEYSKQAPWCIQYEGTDTNGNGNGTTRYYGHSNQYPKIDCGISAPV